LKSKSEGRTIRAAFTCRGPGFQFSAASGFDFLVIARENVPKEATVRILEFKDEVPLIKGECDEP
jgi:hypothetical protein